MPADTVKRSCRRLPDKVRLILTGSEEHREKLFTPEMVAGGYRKKYLRATSRLLALSRFAEAND